MPGLDTNVLVRWLVRDDDEQVQRVQVLLESAQRNQFALFVPNTVTLELEWVLRSRYKFDKKTILETFNALLETQEIEFQNEAALERALHQYRGSSAEFADCLHAGICRAADRAPLLTFDDKTARLANTEMLEA